MPNEASTNDPAGAEASVGELTVHDIPSSLLGFLTAPGGGRVVLVTGAGSSIDWPTNLLSGADYAEEAHRRLVADGVLSPTDCPDPRDLSVLADVVYDKTASQGELAKRLPVAEWQAPTPNSGHRVAAALLIEGILRSIVTLNFDLAFQIALAELGMPAAVTIARGPEDHDRIGSRALIYLHRSVETSPDSWILRESDLERSWKHSWEDLVASGALAAPATLFAGLGSPAAVLTETVRRFSAIGQTRYYFADPYPDNRFGQTLAPFLDAILELGWTRIMDLLSRRVVEDQLSEWTVCARRLCDERGVDRTDMTTVIAALLELDLVALGHLRSNWLLHDKPYLPADSGIGQQCLSDLALALASIYAVLPGTIAFTASGLVEIKPSEAPRLSLAFAHGGGVKSWSSVSARIEQRWAGNVASTRPRVVVVAGVDGLDTVPQDLIHNSCSDDLVRGFDQLIPVSVDEVRSTLLSNAEDLKNRLAA